MRIANRVDNVVIDFLHFLQSEPLQDSINALCQNKSLARTSSKRGSKAALKPS